MIPALAFALFAATPPAAEPLPDPAALARQLGGDDFAEREAAATALKELGARAEPALKAALTSDDPEVRGRAAELLKAIRRDALDALAKTFDPAGAAEPDHPVWRRYKAAAGSDGPARRLFAEMIRDPQRLRVLDVAEANPDRASELYERHVKRIGANVHKGLDYRRQLPAHLIGNVFDTNDPTPKPVDVALAFYLGTFPTTAKALPDPRWAEWGSYYGGEEGALFGSAFQDGLDLPYRGAPADRTTAPAFARLFAAWLAVREHPGSIRVGLAHARFGRVAEALPAARAVLADAGLPLKVRGEALPIVGAFGGAKDEALVAALPESKTVVSRCKYGPAQKEATVEARDLVLATRLVLRGKDPGEFGFPGLEFHGSAALRDVPLYPHYLGFYDDASRAAAHQKAKQWLK